MRGAQRSSLSLSLMASADDDYREVWQTWHLVRTSARAADAAPLPCAARTERPPELRQRVQMARVTRRWAIADLAAHAQCDAETLAAFERGDEVLHADLQRRVRQALEL